MSVDMFAFLRSRLSATPGRETVPTVIDAPLLDALADAHAAAAAAADASFTPERAAAQRAAVLARLGATADPRILSFPPRALDAAASPASPRAASPRPALGWMLTAAAAGLVVGVGTGQGLYLEWQPNDGPAAGRAPVAQARQASTPPAAASAANESDDAFLRDVEVALAERGVDELQPLDALTPRVTLVASR